MTTLISNETLSQEMANDDVRPLATATATDMHHPLSHWTTGITHAADTLEASERRHRLAVAASGAAIFEYNIHTQVVTRTGYQALIGEGQDGARGSLAWWADRVHPDDRAAYKGDIEAMLGGGRDRVERRYRVRHVDGSWRWVWHRGIAEYEDGQRTGLFVGSIIDVNEEHRARDALRESEARLRRTVDELPLAAWILQADGTTVFLNKRLREYFGGRVGFPPEDRLIALHPEDEPAMLAARDKALSAITSCEIEVRARRHDGAWRWHRLHLTPVRSEDGTPAFFISTAVDIHDARAAAEELAASEARWRAMAESIPGPVFETDPDGFNTYTNAFFQAFTGRTAEALLGRGWLDVLHPDDRPHAIETWGESLCTLAPYQVEYRMRASDGTYRWFLCRGNPQLSPDGAVLRWFGTAMDVTDIVSAREQAARVAVELEVRVEERTRALAETARELSTEMRRREEVQSALLQAQKLEALGQLTGGIAHDFNNVLAAISGSYELLARRATDPAQHRLIDNGRRAVDRAANLVRQLLSFARKQELRPTVLDLTEITGETKDLIAHSLGASVTCEVTVEPGTWTVLADRHQLDVALINLAANARDAMPEGGTLRIAARNLPPDASLPPTVAPGSFVSITVEDTGLGMPVSVLAHAMEPFFTTKAVGKGSGLGLAMVHGFAVQSGGGLCIHSHEGRGTTVEILLPRAGALSDADADCCCATDPQDSSGYVILLIEDDEHVRPVAAAFLTDLGYNVVEAANADGAYALSNALGRLDLIVSDVRMPGVHGPVIVEKLRQERPGLPVIYITGYADHHALLGETVLQKPFSMAELGEAVRHKLPG